ncbi:MAG: 2-C-methyl-D-erythritol 4-phosphate cytidylyltransferase [Planctomycetota bacterium]|nr:2-C-methyl-D-erythritol 4-phosphate cytidylyltransferase [Planctomycetota bacterium]
MTPAPPKKPRASAVIVAAGGSARMGTTLARKPLLDLGDRPILEHACAAFQASERTVELIVVAHPEDADTIRQWVAEREAFAKVLGVVDGGGERAESVRLGVKWCSFDVDVICVHDAARPLVEPAGIDATIDCAAARGAAILALPVRDTLKSSPDGRVVDRTVDRNGLWAAQTPQAFQAGPFREMLARAEEDSFSPPDDASLWERYEGPVAIVEGSPDNLKVTTPADLELARAVLASRMRASG